MNKIVPLCFFFILASLIGVASAQVSGDWQIGPDWSGTDLPTPSPTPLAVITNVFGASLSAIGMFAVVPIISATSLILSVVLMFRSGEEVDIKIIVAGIILVLAVNIFAAVGILIINGVQTAIPAT